MSKSLILLNKEHKSLDTKFIGLLDAEFFALHAFLQNYYSR